MYSTNYKDLIGKTILEICEIRAEPGRTYHSYMGVTCSDGTRVLIAFIPPYKPDPTLEEMRKTFFFTPEEICDKVMREEYKKRDHKRLEEEQARREYERLRERFQKSI